MNANIAPLAADASGGVRYELNVSKIRSFYKPSGRSVQIVQRDVKRSESIRNLTKNQIKKAVCQGCTFTPAVLTGTHDSDWQRQQIFCLDMDDGMPPENAAAILARHGIGVWFGYYSFSHTPELPKYRLMICMSEVVTNPMRASQIQEYLISLLPADKAAVNLGRIFYGTNKGLIDGLDGGVTDISAIPKSTPKPPPKQKTPQIYTGEGRGRLADIIPPLDNNNKCSCPLHQDGKTKSFKYFPDTDTFHCWGCQKSGDIVSYCAALWGMDTRDPEVYRRMRTEKLIAD